MQKKQSLRLVRNDEAAQMLGVSTTTLWRYCRDGVVPKPVKLGGSTRWRVDELEAAIERLSAERY